VKPQAVFSVGARHAQKEQQQGTGLAGHQSRGKTLGFVYGIRPRSGSGLPGHQSWQSQINLASFCVGAQSSAVQVEDCADGFRR
jgi:hypothetical protein